MSLQECLCCPYQSEFPFAFAHHVSNHHKNIDTEDRKVFICTTAELEPYTCNQCEFTADTRIELLDHCKREHEKKVFIVDFYDDVTEEPEKDHEDSRKKHRCVHCDFVTYSNLVLLKHYDEWCPVEEKSICAICNYTAKTPHGFLVHQGLVHKLVPTGRFECDQCTHKTTNKHLLMRHIICMHRQNEEVVEWHQCPHCPYKAKLKPYLTNHVKRRHCKAVKSYQCHLCLFKTKYSHVFKIHTKRKHTIVDENDYVKCSKCEFKTKLKEDLDKHIHLNHNKAILGEFKCSECDYVAVRNITLTRHYENKHKQRKATNQQFECAECSYVTKYKVNLRHHILRKHTDPSKLKRFPCDKCEWTFILKEDLKKHQKNIHGDRRWLLCDKCKFKTHRPSLLRDHVKFQHGKFEWIKCDLCDYKGRNKKAIKSHFRNLHTPSKDIKWHHCTFCKYKAKITSDVYRHIKRNHNKK